MKYINHLSTVAIVILFLAFFNVLHAQTWTQNSTIGSSETQASDQFGWDGDAEGNLVIIGATAQDYDAIGANYLKDAGAVYVFEKSNFGGYVQTQKLVEPNRQESARFGFRTELHGQFLAISSMGNFFPGKVLIFKKNPSSGLWQYHQTIQAPSIRNGNNFGFDLSMNSSHLLISSDDIQSDYSEPGAVHSYLLTANGYWTHQQKLTPSDRGQQDKFGLSLSMDNDRAVIGSPRHGSNASSNPPSGPGAAYVFELDASGSWVEMEKLSAQVPEINSNYGRAVHVSGDHLLVGSFDKDLGALTNAGAVYYYQKSGNNWMQKQYLVASDPQALGKFGFSLDVHENRALISAHTSSTDSQGGNYMKWSGAAYVFELVGDQWIEQQKLVHSPRGQSDYFGHFVALQPGSALIGAPNHLGHGSAFAFGLQISDTMPPTPPQNLVVSNISTIYADLSWTPATDHIGVTSYEIFLNGLSVGDTPSSSFALTGLNPSTQYGVTVVAYDAANNQSFPAMNLFTTLNNAVQTIAAHYFETGWDGWIDGGSDCYRYNSSAIAFEGNYSIRLRDNSRGRSTMTSPNFELGGFDQVQVDFEYYPNSMENGEDFSISYSSGSGWQTIGTYVAGQDFTNGSHHHATIVLPANQYNLVNGARFRIRCDASSNYDQVYIDAFELTGVPSVTALAKVEAEATALSTTLQFLPERDDLDIYPNPVSDLLFIDTQHTIENITVVDQGGRVHIVLYANDEVVVGALPSGTYFLRAVTPTSTIVRKFIKR